MNLLSEILRPTSPAAVGLDLSERGLCWLELRRDPVGGLLIERCLFEVLTPGCIVDGQIAEFQEVEAALGRLIRLVEAGQVRGARQPLPLALSVPAGMVTIHRTRYAGKLLEADLAERLQAEMSSLLRSTDELSLDFVYSYAPSPTAPDLGTEVVAAAVPTAAVEDRIALIEGTQEAQRTQGLMRTGLRLRPVSVAMASQMVLLAAYRAIRFRSAHPDVTVALVQVDRQALQLDVVRQTGVLSSTRFPMAASRASAEISSVSSDPAVDLPAGLLEAIEAAQGAATVARPWRLWVTGSDVDAAAWATVLQERTGLPCAVVDPFVGMVPGRALDGHGHRSSAASQALVACGLALTALGLSSRSGASSRPETPFLPVGFNFLPHREIASAGRQKSFLMQICAAALSVLLASTVFRLALSEKLASGQAVQAEQRNEIARLDAEVRRQAVVAADMPVLQRQQAVLTSFAQKRDQTPQMLRELGLLLPEGLHLTSFRIDQQGEAIISGQARSAAEVFALMSRLSAASQHFKRAALLDLSLPADSSSATAQPAASNPLSVPVSVQAVPLLPFARVTSTSPVLAAASVVSPQPGDLAERVIFTIRTQP